MSVDLQPVSLGRLAAVVALATEVESDAWSLQQLQASHAAGDVIVGLYQLDQLIGYMIYHRHVDQIELYKLCVARGQQGRGFGRKLLRALLDVAYHQQVDKIFLEVHASNARARQLYESVGFLNTAIRPRYYRDGEDAILMALTIR